MTDLGKALLDEALSGDENPEVESDASGLDDLGQITAERDRYLDQLQRSLADFANFGSGLTRSGQGRGLSPPATC